MKCWPFLAGGIDKSLCFDLSCHRLTIHGDRIHQTAFHLPLSQEMPSFLQMRISNGFP